MSIEFKEMKDSLILDITKKIEEVKSANEDNLKKHDALNDAKIANLANLLAAETKKLETIEAEMARPSFGSSEDEQAEAKSFSNLVNSFGKKGDVSSQSLTAYKKAFEKLVRGSMNIALLDPEEQKALQVGNDAQGGFLVRPEMSNVIIQKAFETSPIRSLANVVSISSDSYEQVVDFDDFDAAYIAELATKNVTNNTTFSKVRIEAEEIYAKPLISNKMLEDSSVNIESYVIGKLADKFARKEATSFVSGSGVGEAKGLLSYTDGTVYGKVQQVETAGSLAISSDDLLNLAGQTKSKYHTNGRFLMSRVTFFSKVLTLKASGSGEYLIESFRDPKTGGIVNSILGYPVVFADDMLAASLTTAFTAGQLPIIFGDIREAYTIVDRLGVSVLRDPYTQDGAVKFSARKRVGGAVVNTEAYKILKIKA